MRIIPVEIRNDIALSFLKNLESINLIRLLDKEGKRVNQKPSERFFGCISKERAGKLQKELKKMRNEWERDIH